MPAPIILAEKLRRPEPSGLARLRLEAPLLNASANSLALVVGPPGSGKTTLLTRVAAASPKPVAWYRITADDGNEAAVVAYLARVLGDSLKFPAATSGMSALLESLDRAAPPATMVVLDDLHEIAGTDAEKALERFVTLRPPALQILLGSRRQPAFNIPRLRVSGSLQEITSDDLRFRYWEVEELFEGVYREPLSPESAAALTRRTGGWAAGLQLFHLSTSGRTANDRRQAVADLGGRSKLIRSYLARNVLAELPPDRREFLLRTCTLGTLTGRLCDDLLQTTGSARILDELEQQQLFTSSEDDGQTFRYHEVLRTHLEVALFEEYGPAGARDWFERSAVLLESVGELRAAVRAYARAENWGAVARLIQGQGAATAGAELLLPPGLLLQDPWLALADARRRLRSGHLSAAVEAFRRAEDLLDEPEFTDQCRRERRAAIQWLPTGLPTQVRRLAAGAVSSGAGHAPEWTEILRDGTRFGPGPLPPMPLAGDAGHRLAVGVTALMAGEFHWAATVITSVLDDSTATGLHRLIAELARMVVELATGEPGIPDDRLGQVALEAEVQGLPWVARLIRGLQEALLVASGTAPWRIGAVADLLTECDSEQDQWGAALLQLAAAIAGEAAGDPGTEIKFVDAAARFAALEAPVLETWAAALLARYQARAGHTQAAAYADQVRRIAESLSLQGPVALALSAGAIATGSASAAHRARSVALACGLSLSEPAPEPAGVEPTPVEPAFHLPIVTTVQITVLGGFTMTINATPVSLDSLRPRARILLRLLAFHANRDVHRETIIDALWPGADLLIGTRRLQVAVSSVRQLLEHHGVAAELGLVRHGESYRLALPEGSRVDLRIFEAELQRAKEAGSYGGLAACVTAREAALAEYGGDLLPEDGAAEYLVVERERLRLTAAVTATALAQDCRQLGLVRQAQAAARRSVQLDPFQDVPWQILADLHEASGDLSAAEQVRREHAKVRASLEADSFSF